MTVLEVKGLTYSFGKQPVLDNISLTLKKGDIAGLIGNNGAGKTTLMKLISGILERPNGTIDLNTKTVGALIEAPALYPNMTVEANLKFYCRLYHKDYSLIDCYKEDLEVATYLKRKASKLSLGMKQRVGLFIALIASDEFILLDEPTNGLDPNGINSHGTTLGGVIVDSGKFDWEGSGKFASLTEPNPSYHGISFTKAVGPAAFVTKVRAILLRDTGATLSPFNSFLLLQGLETLSLRVERHVENALKVVKYLESQPQVEKVHHPSVSDDPKQQALYAKYFPNGGGSIFTFEIKGDAQKAKDFIDNLELFSLLANVADVKSLVIHPATTTHSQCTEEELLDQGIKPNTIRLSIGTENVDDIIEDLDEAFKAVQ